MPESDIYKALAEIFEDVFMVSNIELKPELSAKDVPGWDSFKQIEIILALQEKYSIKLNTKEVDGLENVGDLVRVVSSKLKP